MTKPKSHRESPVKVSRVRLWEKMNSRHHAFTYVVELDNPEEARIRFQNTKGVKVAGWVSKADVEIGALFSYKDSYILFDQFQISDDEVDLDTRTVTVVSAPTLVRLHKTVAKLLTHPSPELLLCAKDDGANA